MYSYLLIASADPPFCIFYSCYSIYEESCLCTSMGKETILLWSINPTLVYPAIIAAEVWQWTPFMFCDVSPGARYVISVGDFQ